MSAFEPRFTINNAITAGLTTIERARGFLEAATLSDEWVRRMSQRALLLEAHHTTHIEGTHLTIEQAERLLAGETLAEADADDVRELLNYRDAFEFVSGYLSDGGPVTEGLIREIHRRLVVGVRGGKGGPGEYRAVQNYVANSRTREILYTPPPPQDAAPLMLELVEWLGEETDIHPVLVAGIAQYQLVHIHPFLDGNGRTSRLLSTLSLYRAGYDFKRLFSISEYYDRDRLAFYAAIQSVRAHDMDLTSWVEFFIQGLSTQMAEITDRGKRVILRDVIAREHDLNPRQAQIVEKLLKDDEVRIEDLEALLPSVNRRTLQRDLQGLVQRGVAKLSGAGRAARYSLKVRGL
jgi:Fic family protein